VAGFEAYASAVETQNDFRAQVFHIRTDGPLEHLPKTSKVLKALADHGIRSILKAARIGPQQDLPAAEVDDGS
jgi:hypothetical protein